MGTTYLTIGQMADLNHVSTQTLRLYDKEGLLKPAFYDEENGYRYYMISQCTQLDMIQTMKLCGMSLKQIGALLSDGSMEEWYFVLSEQEELLAQKMRHIAESRKAVSRLRTNIRQLDGIPSLGKVFLEYMPERKIDMMVTEYNYFTDGFSGYEKMLRKLKKRMIESALPLSYFYNAGTMIEKEDFINHEYIAQTIFIFVDNEYPHIDSIKTLQSGMYLCVCADDPHNEKEYTDKLYEKINRMGYKVAGDYLCEVISQLPVSKNKDNNLIYKAQVPVTK